MSGLASSNASTIAQVAGSAVSTSGFCIDSVISVVPSAVPPAAPHPARASDGRGRGEDADGDPSGADGDGGTGARSSPLMRAGDGDRRLLSRGYWSPWRSVMQWRNSASFIETFAGNVCLKIDPQSRRLSSRSCGDGLRTSGTGSPRWSRAARGAGGGARVRGLASGDSMRSMSSRTAAVPMSKAGWRTVVIRGLEQVGVVEPVEGREGDVAGVDRSGGGDRLERGRGERRAAGDRRAVNSASSSGARAADCSALGVDAGRRSTCRRCGGRASRMPSWNPSRRSRSAGTRMSPAITANRR